MHFTRFRQLSLHVYVALRQWQNRVNALCYMDLNNRRTGKDATKTRALGLLGHSELVSLIIYDAVYNTDINVSYGVDTNTSKAVTSEA